MELDGILADILIALAGYWLPTGGDLRKVDHHSSLQSFLGREIGSMTNTINTIKTTTTNLVKIVLVVVSMFVTRKRDVVQVYELLEVRESVGTVGQVGFLKNVYQVK